MRGVLNYLGQVILYFVSVSLMVILWLSNEPIGNMFSLYIIEPWVRILIMLGVAALGYISFKLFDGALKVLGFMAALGAVFGAGVSLIHVGVYAISHANPNGFWGWAGLFVVCSILLALFGSVFFAGLKGAYRSVMQLDFFSTIIYLMIGWTGFFGVGESIMAMVDCSVGLFVLVLIAGVPAGYSGGAAYSAESFLDQNGQLHFVSSHLGNGRVLTTEGKKLRKMPGGFTEI